MLRHLLPNLHWQEDEGRPPPQVGWLAFTIARMPARIASGRSGQASTTAARSGSVLQVSVGKWWATLGAGCRKSFGNEILKELACGLIIHHQSLPEAALTIAKKSGVSSQEIRCRFIFSGKNDELTPDFGFSDTGIPRRG
jgi:hypothetical protein